MTDEENVRKTINNMFSIGCIVAGWRKDIITRHIKDAKFEKYNLIPDKNLLFQFGYRDKGGNFIIPDKNDIWIRVE